MGARALAFKPLHLCWAAQEGWLCCCNGNAAAGIKPLAGGVWRLVRRWRHGSRDGSLILARWQPQRLPSVLWRVLWRQWHGLLRVAGCCSMQPVEQGLGLSQEALCLMHNHQHWAPRHLQRVCSRLGRRACCMRALRLAGRTAACRRCCRPFLQQCRRQAGLQCLELLLQLLKARQCG